MATTIQGRAECRRAKGGTPRSPARAVVRCTHLRRAASRAGTEMLTRRAWIHMGQVTRQEGDNIRQTAWRGTFHVAREGGNQGKFCKIPGETCSESYTPPALNDRWKIDGRRLRILGRADGSRFVFMARRTRERCKSHDG